MKKKILRIVIGVVLIIVALFVGLLIFLSIREYRPQAEEKVEVSDGTKQLRQGDPFTVVTYNTGYAGLDCNEDFFMDGGFGVRPKNKKIIEENLAGIVSVLKDQDADCYFLQEIDLDSKRSYYIDQQKYYEENLGLMGMYACNFKCDYVPYPFPPLGKVDSGLLSMTDYTVNSATRISLPESFQWPVKTCNLKRCMLETRIPLQGTEKELVLINFHLEAYDDGEGKLAQSKVLAEKLAEEYEKGNYVIAGGDFNQTFEEVESFPVLDEENWAPGTLRKDDIPEHFSFAVADHVPTCRLLNDTYKGNYNESQVYILDGFIVSDNIKVVNVKTIDTAFQWADHQPVRLDVVLENIE